MGTLGVVIGWPLLMGMIIVTSNTAGVLTGEWNDVSGATKRFLALGMLIILLALGILILGGTNPWKFFQAIDGAFFDWTEVFWVSAMGRILVGRREPRSLRWSRLARAVDVHRSLDTPAGQIAFTRIE